MGLKNCQIYFDNPSATYIPGQTVNGKVEFTLNSKKKTRGVSLSFRGEAQVNWFESETHKDSNRNIVHMQVPYNGTEEYFYSKYYLIGGGHNETIELPLGTHVFPFSTVLPNILPSSYEDEIGYIRYTVKATLERPWKVDQSLEAKFKVILHLDCNSEPKAREPATLTMENFICCLCCREGPITGVLKLPCTGYVSSQVIPYVLEIDNPSKTEVESIKIKIKKFVSYHCQTPKSKTKKETVVVAEFVITDQGVPGQTNKTFAESFTLPALPPSNLPNCQLIDLEYELKIYFDLGWFKNMIGKIPITIGTIPVMNMTLASPASHPEQTSFVSDAESAAQPLLGWIPGSGSPMPVAPLDSSLLPPPTYDECQNKTKSILDPSYKLNSLAVPAEGSSMMPVPVPVHAPVPVPVPVPVHVPVPTVSNVLPSAPAI